MFFVRAAVKRKYRICMVEFACNLKNVADNGACCRKFAGAGTKKIAAVMVKRLHCDGLNLVQNNGEAAGQTVKHFHVHVIPRYKGDGQNINWVPGSPSQEELESIREAIVE